MVSYLATRVLQAVPTLLAVTLVAFLLLQLTGDVTGMMLPAEASQDDVAAFRRAWGLDQPLPVQYVRYLVGIAQGDFGKSFQSKRPAMEPVLERLPATVELSVAAMTVALIIAVPAGVLSATRRNSIFDRLATGVVLFGQTTPTFWLGLILILIFAVQFQVLPVSGRGTFAQLVLPSVTLAMWLLALVARLTRSGMLEVLNQDYVRTARAKGLTERAVTLGHALRNALIPVVTVVGLEMGSLLGGAVMTETVFNWPGVGTLVLSSIRTRDYPVVLAALIMVTSLFVLVNLVVDLICTMLDPRIVAERRG